MEKNEKHDPCEKEFIKGGLAEGFNAKEIATKHAVPVEDIENQIAMGKVIERKEHTEKGNDYIAEEIGSINAGR